MSFTINYDYLYLFIMILSMSNSTILTKLIYNYNYDNYILLTLLSTLCLIPFMFFSKIKLKDNINLLYFKVIIFDTIRTSLSFIILYFLPASIYTLLRMQLELVGSSLYARIKKHKILSNLELLSLTTLSFGSILFVISTTITLDLFELNVTKTVIGLFLTVIRSMAQVFGSEYETQALTTENWDPSYLVGAQALGSFTLELIIAVIIIITKNVNLIKSQTQITTSNTIVIFLIISFILVYIIHNLSSQQVQKRLSPLIRNVSKTSIPIVIWLELVMFKQEKVNYDNLSYQILGIVIYFLSSLLYIYARNKKKKLILILGPSGVGKDSFIKKLLLKYPKKFIQFKTCTTRQPRLLELKEIKEKVNININNNNTFMSQEEFDYNLINNNFMSHLKEPYGDYGILKKDVILNNKIVISQDYGELEMRKHFDVKAIYINFCDYNNNLELIKQEMQKRILIRQPNMCNLELEQRLSSSLLELQQAVIRPDLIFCINEYNRFEESYDNFEKIIFNLV
jgi:guanylate kinase